MVEIRKMTDEYSQMRELWCKTFGDKAKLVDAMFEAYGVREPNPEIEAYIVADGSVVPPRVLAATTQFRMGELVVPGSDKNVPVYISYAICADEAERGKGYGSMITEFARDEAEKKGGVSMLSPANSKLVKFYQPLGYEPRFYVMEKSLEVDYSVPHKIGDKNLPLKLEKIDAAEYSELREKLLASITHVKLSPKTVAYIEETSKAFVKVDGGRVIACVDSVGRTKAVFSEVLGDETTTIADIEEAVNLIAQLHEMKTAEYRTVGGDYLQTGRVGGEYVQGMIARNNLVNFSYGYLGFPLD